MKHFMQPRSRILKENHAEGTQTPSPDPIRQRLPSFSSRKQKSSKENAPPLDLNCAHEIFSSPTGKPLPPSTGKLKSPLPPRPPSSNSNPLKRKLNMDTVVDCANPGSSDSGVKVVVRMRPPIKDDEGETVVQKVAGDSLSILGQPFTFDSVADTGSTQLDMFELVGAPLVENCLAGFNSSVFAYGQTGSGKTYTMWGPANALLEENALDDRQGLTPRVLERLFARINEEQIRHADKQLKYQCRCSFLEIYNEQITDLLEPTQRNLQIREDVKSGVYVENLTEECIFTMKDVAQLLTKGLLNRRTGATSKNAESSRSHSVFTCIVESRCKSTADGISSFKTSRINLVDLAGSERQKLTGAAGERLKEAKNINRSLSQLGNLINILAEVSQTGKQRHIPYRDSRLTFLLQESLGGNAKLAMVCAISPAQSCKSETLSTLRFAQRAKAIKNKAVVNEIMQDDVNFLRKVIRQLKEELLRVKAGNPIDANSDYSTGWIARRSYHLLKFSLSRPTALPHDDNDSDEDMEIDEDAVEKVCAEVGIQSTCSEERRSTSYSGQREIVQLNSEGISEDAPGEDDSNNSMDVNMEEGTPEPPKLHESMRASCVEEGQLGDGATCHPPESEYGVHDGVSVLDSPSAVPCEGSPVLRSPTPSVSPEVSNSCRKVLRTSLVASLKDLEDNSGMSPGTLHMSFAKFAKDSSSSKKSHPPAELLAASLHRGLEIIENYRQNSPLGRSFRSSLKTFKPVFPVQKVEVGVQTVEVGVQTVLQAEDRVELLCSKCRIPKSQSEESDGSSNLQLVLVDGSHSDGKSMKQVPKAVEKVLAGAIRREMALEEVCAKQTSEIMHLNRLAQQYIHERECNAIIGQMREDKILRLESLMDGVLPAEDFMEEELASLTNEHKLLNEKYENHPDVLQTKIELKRALDECEQYQTFFDLGEREVLMEEIRDLRSHLQSYVDPSSSTSAQKRSSSPLLTKPPCEPCLASPPLSTVPESMLESMEDKLEQERAHWTEAESKWISLAEELRIELESSRCLAEKLKRELDSVKKHADELEESREMDKIVYARVLDQQADLEVKHMELLARYRRIKEGIDDVKKAAQRAGVRGTESKFINALAAEISVLKLEREKERRYLRDENKGLQAQLQDTAEAVQAAGELLVRLKEAEEAAAGAQKRVVEAEQETDKAYKQIDRLKRKHEKGTGTLNLEESRYPQEESLRPAYPDSSKFDVGDQQWKEEFEPFFKGGDDELSKLAEPSSWFAGYDRCNI